MKKKIWIILLAFSFILQGCQKEIDLSDYPSSKSYTKDEALYIETPLENVMENNYTIVDYSNIDDGYICARLKDNTNSKMKM